MKAKYILRLDDICPTMNWDKFFDLEKLFDKYNIKPIIGVIPDNRDEKLIAEKPKENFWEIIKKLHEKGWVIAQHGYRHEYETRSGGILNINKQSEFSALPYSEQLEKVRKGKEILENNLGIKMEWWMAPSHSFDKNTCKALKELNFKYITDGIAISPFEKYGLTWIPQQLWSPRKKIFGLWTICVHLNSVDEKFISNLEKFIRNNNDSFANIDFSCRNKFINVVYYHWWKFQYLIYKLFIK
jgi:predicted deacetylase